MLYKLSRQELVRLAWGHRGDPAGFDPKPLYAEIRACAGAEGRHLSRALPKLWQNLDRPGFDGMQFATATRLTSEAFEALMGVLSKGRARSLLDYRFPASPAAMLLIALAVGRFSLKYHGGSLAAKPEGFWYPPHISLAFARVWPNHLGLELYEGLVDSLMNVPSRGILDLTSLTVGRVEPFAFTIDDEPQAAYGREGERPPRPRLDGAEDWLREVRASLHGAGQVAVPPVCGDPSDEELLAASTVLGEVTGWDGSADSRPHQRQAALLPAKDFLRAAGAAMIVAAYLRAERSPIPNHNWSRAKLVMAIASVWPESLDIGAFDRFLEIVYGSTDHMEQNIVGLIG